MKMSAITSALTGFSFFLGATSSILPTVSASDGRNSFVQAEKKSLAVEYGYNECEPLLRYLENNFGDEIVFDEDKESYTIDWNLDDPRQFYEAARNELVDWERSSRQNRDFFYSMNETIDRNGRFKYVGRLMPEYDKEKKELFSFIPEMYSNDLSLGDEREDFMRRERNLYRLGVPASFARQWNSLGNFLDGAYNCESEELVLPYEMHPKLEQAFVHSGLDVSRLSSNFDLEEKIYSLPPIAQKHLFEEIAKRREHEDKLRNANAIFVPFNTPNDVLENLLRGEQRAIVYKWSGFPESELPQLVQTAKVNPDVQFIVLEPSNVLMGYHEASVQRFVKLDGGAFDTFVYVDGAPVRQGIGIMSPSFYGKVFDMKNPEKNVFADYVFKKVPEPKITSVKK